MPKRRPTPEAAAAVNVSNVKQHDARASRARREAGGGEFALRVVREVAGSLWFDVYKSGGFYRGAQLCEQAGMLVVPLYVTRRYCDRGSVLREGESQPQKWVILCIPLPRDGAQLEGMVDRLEDNLLRVDISDDGALPIFDRMLARKIGDTTAPLWAQRWRLVAVGDGLGIGWTLSPSLGDTPMPTTKDEAILLRDLSIVVREAAGDDVLELDLDWFTWTREREERQREEQRKKDEESAAREAAPAPPSTVEAPAAAETAAQ